MYICQHRTSFPKEQSAKAQVEEVFHIDLCDKINQLSSGELYYFFFLLKDDYSRYCYLYFLKEKTEILNYFNQFYADVKMDILESKIIYS